MKADVDQRPNYVHYYPILCHHAPIQRSFHFIQIEVWACSRSFCWNLLYSVQTESVHRTRLSIQSRYPTIELKVPVCLVRLLLGSIFLILCTLFFPTIWLTGNLAHLWPELVVAKHHCMPSQVDFYYRVHAPQPMSKSMSHSDSTKANIPTKDEGMRTATYAVKKIVSKTNTNLEAMI
jgi:hypothetical protein